MTDKEIEDSMLREVDEDFRKQIDETFIYCILNDIPFPKYFGFTDKGFGPVWEDEQK
jgi:hypothetical protein